MKFEQALKISIHTLLAESDRPTRLTGRLSGISIHTLLAESDMTARYSDVSQGRFQSTLSSQRVTQTMG